MSPVYLQPQDFVAPPPPFRVGEAGLVRLNAQGALHSDTQLRLSANSTHALLGHGVVDALQALGIEGRLGIDGDALVPQRLLERARALFYEADRKTYGGSFEFSAGFLGDVEYRVRVNNREYQRTLSRLQFLLSTASMEGHAVRLCIHGRPAAAATHIS